MPIAAEVWFSDGPEATGTVRFGREPRRHGARIKGSYPTNPSGTCRSANGHKQPGFPLYISCWALSTQEGRQAGSVAQRRPGPACSSPSSEPSHHLRAPQRAAVGNYSEPGRKESHQFQQVAPDIFGLETSELASLGAKRFHGKPPLIDLGAHRRSGGGRVQTLDIIRFLFGRALRPGTPSVINKGRLLLGFGVVGLGRAFGGHLV